MKILRFIFGTCLIPCFSVSVCTAQEWSFAPEVGMNVIPVDGPEESKQLYQVSPSIFMSFHTTLDEHWGIQFGLSVNNRRQRYITNDTTPIFGALEDNFGVSIEDIIGDIAGLEGLNLDFYEKKEADVSLWSVGIPVLAEYRLNNGIYFFGGPYAEIVMGGNTEVTTTTSVPLFDLVDISSIIGEIGGINLPDELLASFLPQSGTDTESTSDTENFSSSDVGAQLGMGLRKDGFNVRLAYSRGFIDYRSDNLLDDPTYNQAIMVTVGYFFGIKGSSSSNLKPKYDLELKQ